MELHTSDYSSAGVEPLLSTSRLAPATASSSINGSLLEEEGVAIKSSAAQAKHVHNHSDRCCVDWCSDVRLCRRWLISHSAGYTSLLLINCPINPTAEMVMHTLQACMLQQSDADIWACLADLAQQALGLFEGECSYSKDSIFILNLLWVFEFQLYAKAGRYHAIEGKASTLIYLSWNQYLFKCRATFSFTFIFLDSILPEGSCLAAT